LKGRGAAVGARNLLLLGVQLLYAVVEHACTCNALLHHGLKHLVVVFLHCSRRGKVVGQLLLHGVEAKLVHAKLCTLVPERHELALL